ncbi:LLM class flavin-dependent oxidoreductase [Glutamicibacter bergerei]|jgi:FMN-dependent oxidoreductase (nitrilotriacetate monooxygenase family)|uniref:LLM class flavin-dependent oxidoreductase n=2 Tax=Glutamicibacter TaxID=1742989 RepID=A0ABV9MM53_9MICC|nr:MULTISPECIES: LLM class flavin-dependent oxidoreductase [Glutamicibacter]PCC34124.1 5,10-methylene tetrahydromethanopterin reductase [Glutamicibacter sp. BW77]GGJ66444.1 reductase [Glutamicibacter ardleyensis]HBV09163.1 FMN-dependent monooxygenase [Micrococcaceae bacterium]
MSENKREILFNAFDMNCVAHQSPGLWRHPADKASTYKTLGYWTHLAKVLEKGKFDGLFLADVLGTYDVYKGSNESPLRTGAQAPVNDPMMLVSAMAAVTENLGFGVTAGTAYEHPYAFARRLATLDHLTEGRVGWNVVTGYLPSAARNMGQEDQMEHDERYNHADEYLEVVYKLLEGSWEDDAVQANKETGVYADPAKVHSINHEGKYFKVPGIAITEPSTQRTPVIYQAGASSRGIKFAAGNAESVFVTCPTRETLKVAVAKIRDAVQAAGRDRYDVKIFAMQTIITDETAELAEAKYQDYKSYADIEGAQVLMSGWMGIDLSEYGPDDVIGENVKSNAIQSTVETFQKASGDSGKPWTIRQLAEWVGVGGFGPITVGSGAEVAEKLIDWVDYTDVDGFNLAYAVTPATFEDIVEYVVPELQTRGAYKTEYTEGSLRHKLFGEGDRVKDTHRAAQYKISNRLVAKA